ncbi:MAG: class I SAM-dependent methyltransferase [Solirubrobacterales bacterium]
MAEIQTTAFETLQLRPDDRFLDVGCGTGAAVRRAAGVAGRSVGVDLSPGMIGRGRELARDVENVEFVEGDSEALPFGDAEFSAILCTTSFHHYPDPVAASSEMARVLAPDGRLVLGDACTDNRAVWLLDRILRAVERSHVSFYGSERLRGFVQAAGLTATGTRYLFGRGYQICSARKEGR